MTHASRRPWLEPKRWLQHGLSLAVVGLAAYAGTWVLLWLVGDGASEPPPLVFDERIQTEENPYIADVLALKHIVEHRYAYLEHRRELEDLDLDALTATALAELGDAPDEPSFRRVIRRFVAGLHDGHAWVRFDKPRLPAKRQWPFTPVLVAEGVMVDGVHPDVAGKLLRGDLVRSVNGLDIERYISETAREIYASSDGARWRKALDWMTNWTQLDELWLRVARKGAGDVDVDVPCPLRRLEIPRPGKLPTGREARMLANGIAFFRPGDFAPPEGSGFAEASPSRREEILADSYAELARTFASFEHARALILDLRGNLGGTDLLGQALVRYLVPPVFTYFSLSALHGNGWSKPHPYVISAPAPEYSFHGRLVCLIDERTFSVADNVAACLRDLHPHVKFIGRNTGSGTGAPRPFVLPRTGTQVTLCTQRVYSPKGRMIEGVGVAPDIEVIRSRDDVLAGRDRALLTALDELGK